MSSIQNKGKSLGLKKTFEEIKIEYFPNLTKKMSLQIHKDI